jgi:hypothetical protein
LDLSCGSRIHNVVSVVHLRKFNGSGDDIRPLPITVDIAEEWEVDAIEGERFSQGAVEFLVKWKGYKDRIWESMSNLKYAQEVVMDWRASQGETKAIKTSLSKPRNRALKAPPQRVGKSGKLHYKILYVREVREHVRQSEECSSQCLFDNLHVRLEDVRKQQVHERKKVREPPEREVHEQSQFGSHVCQ